MRRGNLRVALLSRFGHLQAMDFLGRRMQMGAAGTLRAGGTLYAPMAWTEIGVIPVSDNFQED